MKGFLFSPACGKSTLQELPVQTAETAVTMS